MQNWLDYYQLKFERNASKRPTTKVIPQRQTIAAAFLSYGFIIFESKYEPFFLKFHYNSLEFSSAADWFSWLFWYEGGCY